MSKPTILVGKSITLLLWILVALSAIGAVANPFRWMILGFGAIVLVAHLFEVAFLLVKHRERVRSFSDIVSVLVFGVFTLKLLLDGA